VAGVTSTLKEMTFRVIPSSAEESNETEGEDGEAAFGLGRWIGKGDPLEVARNNKDVYYQYVDDSGTVHFVQNLSDVPAEWQGKAGRIEVERALPAPAGTPPRPTATRRTAAKKSTPKRVAYQAAPEVVVYTTTWCGWCRKTLEYLDQRGVPYTNKDIEADDWSREELIEKTGRTSIPVVEINGEIIRGFNPTRMEQLLGGSG
jgi:glutaredoxin-like YruB-family protein